MSLGKMEGQLCFECLQRRIKSDFAERLVFCYGVSDSLSALPLGSSAVVQVPYLSLSLSLSMTFGLMEVGGVLVQMSNPSGEGSASQFLLDYIPSQDHSCLTKYVNEYVGENLEEKRNTCGFENASQDQIEGRVGIPGDETTSSSSNDGQKNSFENSTCNHSVRFSCLKTITALAPIAHVGICSYLSFEELVANYLSGSLEDHILCSLSLLIEGKASGRDSINFLGLLGIPSFEENNFPGSLRHPNIAPVIGMLKTSGYTSLVRPRAPYTLENILHYSPNTLKSEWHIKFLIYQILSALSYIHGLGVAHGNLCPSHIMLTNSCWSWLSICDKSWLGFNSSTRHNEHTDTTPAKIGCCIEGCPSQGLYADLKLSSSIEWHSDFYRWWRGEMSNFEYLLILNRLAGRRWGDHTFHTIMPWVIDFSTKPDENSDAGWRDLSKSKWRLAKGDEQLDFTYSTSEFPHHVSDECLSELAVCSYKARRLPLSVLRTAVRSVYEPNEYPSTMQRLYQWTPDECIPEFYCDPQIFSSLHAGMTDLSVPSWAGSPEEFIKIHRDALESDRVSHQIHHWVDITFGYKMSGQAAVAAKNVMLPSSEPTSPRNCRVPVGINLNYLLERIEVEGEGSMGYQDLLLWRQRSFSSGISSKKAAEDIFSVGCILAELYLRKPLFDSTSLALYFESGILPCLMQELPPHTKVFVEACIEKDWMRRPSAKSLLDSPHFPGTIKSSYLFLSPLQLLAEDVSRLRYAAGFAKQGALKTMGTFAAEMCAPYCLPIVATPLSDTEAEWAYILLKEFIKCLTPKAVKTLILPAIQKILQATGYSHLKVSILQDSFVREIWNRVGKQAYLNTIHPLVISNLYVAPQRSSAAAASVLLIGSSEELGVPITIHQTILPLIHCFGKGLSTDGIDVLVRIGGLLGEVFIIKQLLPLLKNVVRNCIEASYVKKPEPVQSWSALALIDCLVAIDGLAGFLPSKVVVKELIYDGSFLHVMILMQKNLEFAVLQVAATTLMAVCQRIGPDLTAAHVLPQLRELFDELAFSQEIGVGSAPLARILKVSKPKIQGEAQIESRMDLADRETSTVLCNMVASGAISSAVSWLEGESSRSSPENKRPVFSKGSTSEYNPAKLLLNGVGWSIPQSQGARGTKYLIPQRWIYDVHKNPVEMDSSTADFMKHEPWFWFPSPASSWDGPDFLGRVGGVKDELPWKIRASIIYSVRAHHGALRSLAVCPDECTVFTAGIGPGFKGTIQKWDLTRINCISGYYGHEEVVNDICVLSSSGRIASCDGTIHVWNSRTGKLISVIAEPSADNSHLASPLSPVSKVNTEQPNILNSNTLSSGILTGAFDGSLYTCMHHLAFADMLVVGTGNGSLRFIDISRGQKLHLWKGESVDYGFHSLVSALCSCGSDSMQGDGTSASPSWIAAGLSTGHCRLFDLRSKNVISSWRAHDGYVTKLAAPDDHLLVSSSHDRTLRIWDLRRHAPCHLGIHVVRSILPPLWWVVMNWPPQSTIFKGHTDGVSGFSLWGQDVITISKNRIGLTSLSKSADEDPRVLPLKLYVADNGTKNLSVLTSISILPFSRLFLVGTEDGYLRICC
ncbi:putative inactive serine/threonine-protein kinase lvsG [Morella rubra]|uniref:Putative inactive serine/threonine-protein kinase lvsG n=1 Tax=Morella rubra TaxID=262757 RepID=A0A6A1VLI8_9ROSI|nr:putative inactive serine/threonine-protein kinase lvsG [Morella rubra]